MGFRTKTGIVLATALVAGLVVFGQPRQSRAGFGKPLSEKAFSSQDTGLFGVKKRECELGINSPEIAKYRAAVESRVNGKFSNAKGGKDFAALVVSDATRFYHEFGKGKFACQEGSAFYFDIARGLGFDAKIVFVDKHVLLEVNGYCADPLKGEIYPAGELGRRYTNVYLKTSDYAVLMEMPYIARGEIAWDAGKPDSAMYWARMAAKAAPYVPEPHYNIWRYSPKNDSTARAEENRYDGITSGEIREPAEYYNIGMKQMKEKNYKGAVISFEAALKCDPDFSKADAALVQAYALLGYDRIYHGKVYKPAMVNVAPGLEIGLKKVSESAKPYRGLFLVGSPGDTTCLPVYVDAGEWSFFDWKGKRYVLICNDITGYLSMAPMAKIEILVAKQ